MNLQKEFQLKKLILTSILLGLSGVSAFAKPTWYTAFDVVLPIEFWSAGVRTPVNSTDIVIGGGFNAKAFYRNNFGFFMDFGMGGLLSQTEINGKEPITKPISVFVSAGLAYRIPLKGTSMSIALALGPRYSLLTYTYEKIPKQVTERKEGFFIITTTLPEGKRSITYDTFGLVLESAIIIAFSPEFFLNAGASIGLNFSKELTFRGGRGSSSNSVERKQSAANYFGFAVIPKIGIGFSF